MNVVRIGRHEISPHSIVAVRNGHQTRGETLLVICAMLLITPFCSGVTSIYLFVAGLAVLLLECVAHRREKLKVRLVLRGERVITLSCLSHRDVEATVSRLMRIAAASQAAQASPSAGTPR
ncbi:hypothetical protein ABEG18_20310 [Alsobacter sp. KACC 23698]|uniref:Uncharacterized protein n=1 Tax=Alsobacter sp. KACC 23698 TaxID=3149229 RepID=A0AAU7JCU3_9HYPH